MNVTFYLRCWAYVKEKSCRQMLSKKSSTEVKANVSSKEPQRGFVHECRKGVKLDLRLLN